MNRNNNIEDETCSTVCSVLNNLNELNSLTLAFRQ